MIDIDTLTRLKAMRLSGMAATLEEIDDLDGKGRLTTPEIIRLMVDREWERRRNNKLTRLRREAHLAQPAADIVDLLAQPGRQVDIDLITRLATGTYLARGQDVILQGPTGSGKTYVACALANRACQQYKTVTYLRAAELFDRLAWSTQTGTRNQLLDKLVKVNLLVIDDWFLTAPTREQVQHLHTLIDMRCQNASTIYCTQLPPGKWHDRMEEKIVADAIIDRITASATTITLNCDDSLRRHFNPPQELAPSRSPPLRPRPRGGGEHTPPRNAQAPAATATTRNIRNST